MVLEKNRSENFVKLITDLEITDKLEIFLLNITFYEYQALTIKLEHFFGNALGQIFNYRVKGIQTTFDLISNNCCEKTSCGKQSA